MRNINLKTLLSIVVLAGAASASGAIYKTVDAEGNVVFTDVPPSRQSDELTVEEHNVYTPPTPAAASGTVDFTTPPAVEEETEPPARYVELAILAPEQDLAIRNNAGNMTVIVRSDPELAVAKGHVFELMVDGQVMASGVGPNLALANIDRGTHALTARIVDGDGQVLSSSPPRTFHMLRYSKLAPPVTRNRAN